MAKEKDPLFVSVSRRIKAAMIEARVEGNPRLAELLHDEESRIRNWTNGTSMPPLKDGLRLCHALAITLDYLYRDDTSGLPEGKGIRLRAAEAGLALPDLPVRRAKRRSAASPLASAADEASSGGTAARRPSRARGNAGAR